MGRREKPVRAAAAFRFGVALTDMEFTDFYAYTAIWPPITVAEIWPLAFRHELNGKLLNGVAEDLKEKYRGPEKVPPLAIEKEVKVGQGLPQGTAHLSMRHNSVDEIERVLARMDHPKWLKRRNAIGFDVSKQDVEVAPADIVSFAGCRVNENFATDIPGLRAAGEVGASRERAYTSVGNSLPLSMAIGATAGREAGARVKRDKQRAVNSKANDLCCLVLEPMLRKKWIRPSQLRRKFQEILAEFAFLIGRTEQCLTEALEKVGQIKKQSRPLDFTLPRFDGSNSGHRLTLMQPNSGRSLLRQQGRKLVMRLVDSSFSNRARESPLDEFSYIWHGKKMIKCKGGFR
jgi:succinate dehydrogenase/fumarate reductase flavoprotein subunit